MMTMTVIRKSTIDKLRDAGLFVSEPLPTNSPFPDGVVIAKPITTPGNSIPDYTSSYGMENEQEEVPVNTPFIHFYCHNGKSIVYSVDYIPGPGPGDFVNEWNSTDEALNDIMDFFFGDPSRMQLKPEARIKAKRQPH
jgi:hypothetical protein